MEENERDESGISLSDIFRAIFSQKWLVLIITFAITLAGTLGIYYGLNKSRRTYETTFVIKLPNSADSPTSYSYPDGTRFHFTDMVSFANLEKIKASDEGFKDIDVTEMVQNGGISITRVMVETATGSEIFESSYTLKADANYFKSKEIARSFLVAVTEIPSRHLAAMDIDYDTYLTSAAEAVTYDTQLNYLQSQLDYLKTYYDSFISSYGGSFVVSGGRTLDAYKSDIDVFNSNNRITQLKNEALKNGYIKSEQALEEYKSQKFEYERQLEVEEAVYNDFVKLLKENNSTAIFDNPQIIEQRRIINNLLQKIADLERYITGKKTNEQFASSVSEVETRLRKFTEDFTVVASCVYSNASSVSYSNSNILLVSGELGITVSILVSFVAGLILACIVGFIVAKIRKKKSETAVQTSAPVPVFTEAQLQIAVTDETENRDENKKHDKE